MIRILIIWVWALMCVVSMTAFFFSVLFHNGYEGLSMMLVVIFLFVMGPILERCDKIYNKKEG